MAGDVVGEGYLQPAPDLAVLFPWLDLFNREAGIDVQVLGFVEPGLVLGDVRDRCSNLSDIRR